MSDRRRSRRRSRHRALGVEGGGGRRFVVAHVEPELRKVSVISEPYAATAAQRRGAGRRLVFMGMPRGADLLVKR
jgi:hypothetical protein